MPIIRRTRSRKFTVLNNTVLERRDLSLKAKGLWAFVMTKPDKWQTTVHGLQAQLQEGEASIRAALRELEAVGLYTKKRVFDKNNHINWVDEMYDEPHSGFPHVGNPVLGNPVVENRTQVNTELVRTEQVNTDTTNVVEPKAHGNEEITTIVNSFQELFRIEQPRSERRAAQWLRQKYGVEQTVAMFRKVASAQSADKYCPRTPTITRFHKAIPDLQDYFNKHRTQEGVAQIWNQ